MKFNEKWMLFLMATFISFFGIVDTLLKKTQAVEIVAYESIDSNIKFDNSVIVDYKNNYILYLEIGTTVGDLLKKIEIAKYDVLIFDNIKVKDNDLSICTGDKLVFYVDNEIVHEYYLSVMGDSNGDGVIDVDDLLQLRKYAVGWKNPVNEEKMSEKSVYYYSLDLDMNGIVDVMDLGIMNQKMKEFDHDD